MEIKNFRQAKENALSQRKAQLETVTAERSTRILAEAIPPRDLGELCLMPEVD